MATAQSIFQQQLKYMKPPRDMNDIARLNEHIENLTTFNKNTDALSKIIGSIEALGDISQRDHGVEILELSGAFDELIKYIDTESPIIRHKIGDVLFKISLSEKGVEILTRNDGVYKKIRYTVKNTDEKPYIRKVYAAILGMCIIRCTS